MTKFQEYAVIAGIILLGFFATFKVAEDSIRQQAILCQEGC